MYSGSNEGQQHPGQHEQYMALKARGRIIPSSLRSNHIRNTASNAGKTLTDCWEWRGGHQGSGAGALALREEPVGPGLVQLGRGTALGAPKSIPATDGREWRRCSQAFHSSAWGEGERHQHKLKH